MKKFWLSLGLTLILVGWGGGEYYGFGTSPSFGQYYYHDRNDGYNNYYSAPQADPLSQLLYYFIPPTQDRGTTLQEQQYEQRRDRDRYNRDRYDRDRRY